MYTLGFYTQGNLEAARVFEVHSSVETGVDSPVMPVAASTGVFMIFFFAVLAKIMK
jgi:hypothetical protein